MKFDLDEVDTVNSVVHPTHYNHEDRKECWDEMIETFGIEPVMIFDILTAYKYYYRAGTKKDNSKEQDIAKMRAYLEHVKKIKNKYVTVNPDRIDILLSTMEWIIRKEMV